jgi:hypothetical protein
MAEPKVLPDWKLSEYEYYEMIFGDEQISFWGISRREILRSTPQLVMWHFFPLEL